MNDHEPNPSFELPTPQSVSETGGTVNPETVSAGPEKGNKPIPANPQPASSNQPAPLAPPSLPQPTSLPGATASQQLNDLTADDSDLIEKEWVQKAKQIIAATKDDPHKQTREISHMKADYIQKRYSKIIKTETS